MLLRSNTFVEILAENYNSSISLENRDLTFHVISHCRYNNLVLNSSKSDDLSEWNKRYIIMRETFAKVGNIR